MAVYTGCLFGLSELQFLVLRLPPTQHSIPMLDLIPAITLDAYILTFMDKFAHILQCAGYLISSMALYKYRNAIVILAAMGSAVKYAKST